MGVGGPAAVYSPPTAHAVRMAHCWPRGAGRGGHTKWRPSSRASLRRARDARLAAYRQFGREHDWSVVGLYSDLCYRYPVAPMLGAYSAQAELALRGFWGEWSALVISALVQPGDAHPGRHRRDSVVQLTMLETGPVPLQFTATWSRTGPQLVTMLKSADATACNIEERLCEAAARGDLLPGDHVAADEVELLHARLLRPEQHNVDVQGPLNILGQFANGLDKSCPARH